jgi:hypothetical protein
LTPSLCNKGYKYNRKISNVVPKHREEKAMKIYLFSPETGVYLGKDFAYEAPTRQGGYIIPPGATTIAPPEVAQGLILVFNFVEERWEVLPVGKMSNKPSAKFKHCNNRFADHP